MTAPPRHLTLALGFLLLFCSGPTPAQDTSVKPGINDQFKDPNLKVGEWAGRFETESREVFQQRHRINPHPDSVPHPPSTKGPAGAIGHATLIAHASTHDASRLSERSADVAEAILRDADLTIHTGHLSKQLDAIDRQVIAEK